MNGALACPTQWTRAEAMSRTGHVGWRACLPNTVGRGGGHHTGQNMNGALACPTQWTRAEAMSNTDIYGETGSGAHWAALGCRGPL